MSKRSIFIILLIMLSLGIFSLYSTFAYDEEAAKLENSQANYDLIYSLKENNSKTITVNNNDEKFVDIILANSYDSTVRYGMYYQLHSPNVLPKDVVITLADNSEDPLENILQPKQTRNVSIRITNNSNENIELTIGALIGFENGQIKDLIKNGEVLIK